MTQDTAMPSSATNDDKTVLTVSELNRQARVTIEQRFNQVWVLGEMSNFARPRSGHWYFSLKDERAQVRCAMFANRNRAVRMQPGDGQLVIARGRVSLYEDRGEFQIIVDHLEPAGEGALRQAFDQLKVKLAGEGLFAAERKSSLPAMPRHCVVVSSPTGAAVKDVIAVWRRRFPSLRVTLIPTAVQGSQAEQGLLEAIRQAPQLDPDVVLVTRGGGSLEDLWSFNLETVARALAACPVPTVSAVGHEIDVTICDFVADVRAPTPSAAAEMIVPDAQELQAAFTSRARQLASQWQRLHEYQSLRLDSARRSLQSPARILEQANQRTDDAAERLTRALANRMKYLRLRLSAQRRQLQALGPTEQLLGATRQLDGLRARMGYSMSQQLERQRQSLSGLSRMLHSVSPLPTIARGFAVVTDSDGAVVSSIGKLRPGDETTTYLNDGAVVSEVKRTLEDSRLGQQESGQRENA